MTRRTALSGTILALLALLAVACGPGASTPEGDAATAMGFPKNPDGYADITVDQLAELMEDKDFALVNVHIPYEGELPETDLFIPFDEIADHVDQLPDKDAPIVLYCRSGSMSTSAAQELVELGYSNILEVDGGFNAWNEAGFEFLITR